MLDLLIEGASDIGYSRVVLDSLDFMTAVHGLYRSWGFADREPYPESEIPSEYQSHWISWSCNWAPNRMFLLRLGPIIRGPRSSRIGSGRWRLWGRRGAAALSKVTRARMLACADGVTAIDKAGVTLGAASRSVVGLPILHVQRVRPFPAAGAVVVTDLPVER
jgi:hypothetical protein